LGEGVAGRSIRPADAAEPAGGCLALAGWFAWWRDSGSSYTTVGWAGQSVVLAKFELTFPVPTA